MARTPVRTCIDRMLPIELLLDSMGRSLRENPHNAAALNMHTPLPGVLPIHPQPALAALTGKLWQPGRTLRIAFLDGDPALHERIFEYAAVWTRHANLHFDVTRDPDAEIRISFAKPGAWSYIGVDALSIPINQPTMNFGWLTLSTDEAELERAVTHEFGHALGCIHEHQSPAAGISRNKPAVYEYYAGPPNYWNKKQVDINISERYSAEITQFSQFDPESIMLYPIPTEFTLGDFEVGWNRTLSATMDKQYIAALSTQPRKNLPFLSPPTQPMPASIGRYGEVDAFFFIVTRPETYEIETEGRTDVVASLFGLDDDTRPIAQDDNSGRRKNARIVVALTPGARSVCATQRWFGLGDYAISVRRAT